MKKPTAALAAICALAFIMLSPTPATAANAVYITAHGPTTGAVPPDSIGATIADIAFRAYGNARGARWTTMVIQFNKKDLANVLEHIDGQMIQVAFVTPENGGIILTGNVDMATGIMIIDLGGYSTFAPAPRISKNDPFIALGIGHALDNNTPGNVRMTIRGRKQTFRTDTGLKFSSKGNINLTAQF